MSGFEVGLGVGGAEHRPGAARPAGIAAPAGEFMAGAHNVVLIGGPGTGKTHLATALGVPLPELLGGSADLTGSNRADLDYVLENIVNPNGLIGKDYELHLITLKDGRSVAGMVRQETESALTVQSLTGSDTVAKKDITKHETPGFSMMPPGQLTAFTPEQQRDLIAYLRTTSQVPLPK